MRAILLIGSNLGDKAGYMAEARERLRGLGREIAASRLYSSRPFGGLDQGDFLNAAISFETDLPPEPLLAEVKAVEREIGRTPSKRWGPREIDIDIALLGDVVFDSDELNIPHSGLLERDFFIVPIIEILPETMDPRTGKRLTEALSEMPEESKTIISIYRDERWQNQTI